MNTYKIKIHKNDEMFIPYISYGDEIVIITHMYNHGGFDPFDKCKSLKIWDSLDHYQVAVEVRRGGKIILAEK